MKNSSRIGSAAILVGFCFTAGFALSFSGTGDAIDTPWPAASVAAPIEFLLVEGNEDQVPESLPPRPKFASAAIPRSNWSPARVEITFTDR